MASLNPCCNGIYLIIVFNHTLYVFNHSLNPCCNGIYLIIHSVEEFKMFQDSVLILVVMEYT